MTGPTSTPWYAIPAILGYWLLWGVQYLLHKIKLRKDPPTTQ